MKIFFIGFNKTATTSIHQLFLLNNYKSFHHSDGEKIFAKIYMENLKSKRDLLRGLEEYEAFSDLSYFEKGNFIDATLFTNFLMDRYPEYLFVYQDRNTDTWIQSRIKHKNGDFLKRSIEFYKKDEQWVIEYWKKIHRHRRMQVLNLYSKRNNFLYFHVENDSIEKLIDFAKPHFILDKNHWGKYNSS